MRTTHHLGTFIPVSLLLFLSFISAGSAVHVHAQPRDGTTNPNTARAIEAYQRGDATKAIELLEAIVKKTPDDADAWYYLGLAFDCQGFIGNSRPAFEQFVRLRPNSADAHSKLAFALILANEPQKALTTAQKALELGDQSAESHYAIAEASLIAGETTRALEETEAALRINPSFTAALVTRSFTQHKLKQYSEAAASLEQLLEVRPDDMDADSWRGQIEWLSHQIGPQSNPAGPLAFSPKEVTQKARVLTKPEPMYSEEARKAGVEGTVVLRGVFTSEGKLNNILIVRPLGYGLTTRAIHAARQIRFNPAMKDGSPVSMFIQLEYNFNLY